MTYDPSDEGKHKKRKPDVPGQGDMFNTGGHFNGPVYDPPFDHARLTGQLKRVYGAMSEGQWRTLREIANMTGDPESSVSAQLRHLRKERFGAHVIDKRPRGDRAVGLWEYRLDAQPEQGEPLPTSNTKEQ